MKERKLFIVRVKNAESIDDSEDKVNAKIKAIEAERRNIDQMFVTSCPNTNRVYFLTSRET